MKKTVFVLVLATLIIFSIPLSGFGARSGDYRGMNFTFDRPAVMAHYAGWRGHYWGHRFYWGGSIMLGPWWYPWYPYPYGYYAAPPSYVQPPQVYVQPQQPQQSYWYYCQDPKGYYPYVQSCPGGWMKVLPQTPPPKQWQGRKQQ